jgi:serine/threonine protein phosphatase 1
VRLRILDCPAPPGAPHRAARTPEGTVIYAIGDIHGRDDLLAALLEGVRRDAGQRPARRRLLVFLGDYISRGPGSRAVVERVMALAWPGFELVTLKGNHEDLLLRFLDGDLAAGALWLDYGGAQALQAYGMAPEVGARGDEGGAERLRRELAAALPARHLEFCRRLRLHHREGGYYFVHAGIRPGVPLEQQSDADRLWIRSEFTDSCADHGVVVVHGHCIAALPQVRHNRIGIDTGAYASGHLTCAVLEGDECFFLQT